MVEVDRRSFLRRSVELACAPSLAGAIAMVYSNQARSVTRDQSALVASPYGTPVPRADLSTGLTLLALPPGFEYKSFAWLGDVMADGLTCRGAVDGMAVVRSRRTNRGTELTLVRNHELSSSSNPANQILPSLPGRYDTGVIGTGFSTGGTSTLVFRDGNWIEARSSLGGTRSNCAGGLTPWGSWLSCEEIASDSSSTDNGKRHGYVFEVPADGVSDATPLIGMGRFRHEAAAVDPQSGAVYLTEDDIGKSGLYRFIPNDTGPSVGASSKGRLGSLAKGGRLQMAKVKGMNNAVLVNAPYARIGQVLRMEWVPIAQPDQNRGPATGLDPAALIANCSGPFVQGWAQGALRFNRAEGLWHHDRSMLIIDTLGNNETGVLWQLDLIEQTLTCLYAAASPAIGNMVDNVTVSPRGGILMCEDGGGAVASAGQRVMGVLPGGDSYEFCRNLCNLDAAEVAGAGKAPANAGDKRAEETAGVCFDPAGQTMFLNIYNPGITVAITGPWGRGNL